MGQSQATCFANTIAAFILATLWMGTFVFASVALSDFPIMIYFFTTVLTLALFVSALYIGMTPCNTACLADTLSFFIFPIMRA